MSDRTYAQVEILDCPEDQRAALLAAITSYSEGEIGNEEPEDATTPIGRYGWDEANLDANETIADLIIEAAPGATFETWVDPKYEYSGVVTMYAPDLGRFDGPCDADGVPYVSAGELAKAPDLDTMRRLAGVTWYERMVELYQRNGRVVYGPSEPDDTQDDDTDPPDDGQVLIAGVLYDAETLEEANR